MCFQKHKLYVTVTENVKRDMRSLMVALVVIALFLPWRYISLCTYIYNCSKLQLLFHYI